jgi:hypothetical protein
MDRSRKRNKFAAEVKPVESEPAVSETGEGI